MLVVNAAPHLQRSSPRVESHSGCAGTTQWEAVSKGAISQLQEFVQGAKLFPMPPNCPVLQWAYETRMVGMCLEFQATVAFILDGVPHHIVGDWKHSKKLAQRDSAERALGLFVSRWGELALKDGPVPTGRSPLPADHGAAGKANADLSCTAVAGAAVEVAILEKFCSQLLPQCTEPLQWSHRWEGNLCQAFVEIRLFDVPHTLSGKPREDVEAASADAARRALWYLQCPGFEDYFELDPDYVAAAAHVIPGPPAGWARDNTSEGEEQQLAERKTAVMRVQNRLQQAYARQLEAGTSVWYWSYERDPRDRGGWPPLFRATVHVPLANRTFSGSWLRGQREAQIDACAQISEFLDIEFPRSKGM